MKENKWIDIYIGENAFTVHCQRSDENNFGTTICFKIYELHKHPTNFFERIFESWKYKRISKEYWIESLSALNMRAKIIEACTKIVSINEKHLKVERDWKNL